MVAICALFLHFPASHASGAVYVVDGPGRLTAIAGEISASADPVHRVRFQNYANVGNFDLAALNADSLIFERAGPSAEVVDFSGVLFQIKDVSAAVVFRNLAFRAANGSAKLVQGLVGGSSNGNLLLDSCQIFGDTLNSAFLSWLGTGHTVEMRRSIISAREGQNAMLDLDADSVRLTNCYLNFAGLVAATASGRLEMRQLTANRVQFKGNGDGFGTFAVSNCLFGHPAGQNKLPGEPEKYPLMMLGFVDSSSSAQGNARFDTWSGFAYLGSPAFSEAGNVTLPAFGDTTAMWDFRQEGDTQRGYQNPSGAGFPAYNLFPGETLLALRLGGQDSVELQVAPALIPQAVGAEYGMAAYPAHTDSVRTFWRADTILSLAGPARLVALRFPEAAMPGRPLLFAQTGGEFRAGALGAEGSAQFLNPEPAARVFIPALGAQNTPRGKDVVVNLGDTSLVFASVDRAGRTRLSPRDIALPGPRIRSLGLPDAGGQAVGALLETNAEAAGEVRVGLPREAVKAPHLPDSVFIWFGGDRFAAASLEEGKWWAAGDYAPGLGALLVERLALGAGRDSLVLAQGHRVIAASAQGHQLGVDSSFQPTQEAYPRMGSFSRGLSFSWPGRGQEDSLRLVWRKNHPKQKLFYLGSDSLVAVDLQEEDSLRAEHFLARGDSGRVLFLARPYAVAAGAPTGLSLGPDSVAGLLSRSPGDLVMDSTLEIEGLSLDTLKVLAKRRVRQEGLGLEEPYTAWIAGAALGRPDRLVAYVLQQGDWKKVDVEREAPRYRLNLDPGSEAVVVAELVLAEDRLPVPVSTAPSADISGNFLHVTPVLNDSERNRVLSFHVEAISLDAAGRRSRRAASAIPVDSAAVLELPEAALSQYRIGYESYGGILTWDEVFRPAPVESGAFRSALNEAARPHAHRVWALIGYPHDVDLSEAAPAGDGEDPVVKSWRGRWETLSGDAVLKKGRGYAAWLPQPATPRLGEGYEPALVADTLALDTGWQLIANPLPVPLAAEDIGLEESAVSHFYAVEWDGAGRSADYAWVPADTLRPFVGYAVHAKRKSQLIFHPAGDAEALAKKAHPLRMVLHLESPGTGARTALYAAPGSRRAAGPGFAWMQPRFHASWTMPGGPIVTDSLGGLFFVQAPSSGALVARLTPLQASPLRPAIWDPVRRRLLSGKSPELQARQGWNAYRMVWVEPGREQAVEDALRSAAEEEASLRLRVHKYGRGLRLAVHIPERSGLLDKVVLDLIDMGGRRLARHEAGPFPPGNAWVDLPHARTGAGPYFLRAVFASPAGREVRSIPLPMTGGLP